MNYRVEILPEAMEQVRELAAWWSENRPDSRVDIREAVRKIGDALKSMPRRFPYDEDRGVYRVNIRGTPYHLLFEIDDDRSLVEIVSAWSGQRGEGPELG
ncbi:MAG: type II toxin-antitoxin system RelE/ParE family toxin [Myxococcota bacterium]